MKPTRQELIIQAQELTRLERLKADTERRANILATQHCEAQRKYNAMIADSCCVPELLPETNAIGQETGRMTWQFPNTCTRCGSAG